MVWVRPPTLCCMTALFSPPSFLSVSTSCPIKQRLKALILNKRRAFTCRVLTPQSIKMIAPMIDPQFTAEQAVNTTLTKWCWPSFGVNSHSPFSSVLVSWEMYLSLQPLQVYPLVSERVRLLFGAGQDAHSELIRAVKISCLLLHNTSLMWVRPRYNIKVVGVNALSGENVLWVCNNEWQLSHYRLSFHLYCQYKQQKHPFFCLSR